MTWAIIGIVILVLLIILLRNIRFLIPGKVTPEDVAKERLNFWANRRKNGLFRKLWKKGQKE